MSTEAGTKPEAPETPNLPAPEGAKPPEAAPDGGGETAPDAGAPPREPDWKKEFEGLKTRTEQLEEQHQSALRGMNEAQQRAAFYEKQTQALVGAQPPPKDPIDELSAQADELESRGYYTEAKPLRNKIAAEIGRRAAREEYQALRHQDHVNGTQQRVAELLKDEYGLDPALSAELSRKAASNPAAIAAALALAHDPSVVEKATEKRIAERKRKADAAARLDPLGQSGGRQVPGTLGPDGNPKRRFSDITYLTSNDETKKRIDEMVAAGEAYVEGPARRE